MKLKIRHLTRYRYASPLRAAVQTLCLTPSSSPAQQVHEWCLDVSGRLQPLTDAWGNRSHLMHIDAGVREMRCEASGLVETQGTPWHVDETGPDPRVYLATSSLAAPDAAMRRDLAAAGLGAARDEAGLMALVRHVAGHVAYRPGETDARTTAAQAWQGRGGVCQDQAHALVAACRALGMPARYVSGYFHAVGSERLASHAWAEVCLAPEGRRWFGVDITHACPVDERHVRLAVGPDYAACSPIRGVRSGGGREHLLVELEIVALSA
ncbi:MAG: hypothetical protein RLZZ592_1216 [Pseudomonadota bacterium]|nr:hypothetical protein [Pseudomonadota bacterium]